MKRVLFLLVIVIFFAGCDDKKEYSGAKFVGKYKMETSQKSDTCLDQDMVDQELDAEYFIIREEPFIFVNNLVFYPCESEMNCPEEDDDDVISFDSYVVTYDDPSKEQSSSFASGDICNLILKDGKMKLKNNILTWSDSRSEYQLEINSLDECHYDMVDDYKDEMECQYKTVKTATKID